MTPSSPLIALCVVSLAFLGCAKEEIQSYKVPKEKPKAMASSQMPAMSGEMPADHPPMSGKLPDGHPAVGGNTQMAPTGGPMGQAPAQGANDLTWSAPASWQTKSLGQMRRGSYAIKGEGSAESDLSIFVFPGAAGGVVENINRWRGQIGLSPIAAAALADETTPLRTDSGLEIIMVDLKGSGPDSILGAILTQPGQSWFFKLKGSTPLLQQQKAEFTAFLKTVKTP